MSVKLIKHFAKNHKVEESEDRRSIIIDGETISYQELSNHPKYGRDTKRIMFDR